MADLAQREGVAAQALAFTILTAARSGETRGMTWGELDLDARVWTIPASRMKAAKEHRVPLTDAALSLLGQRNEDAPDDALVFGSEAKPGSRFQDMSMTAVLRRMERNDITVHGFRSSFRDWAGETTSFPVKSLRPRWRMGSRIRLKPLMRGPICSTNGASSWTRGRERSFRRFRKMWFRWCGEGVIGDALGSKSNEPMFGVSTRTRAGSPRSAVANLWDLTVFRLSSVLKA